MAATHGGEMVAAMLAAEDVDTVFGIIDGTYARLTRKLGAAIASKGPASPAKASYAVTAQMS